MPPQWLGRIVLAVSSFASSGCLPDLGECDLPAAEQLTYTDDESGLPAYQGQALVISSCGGGAFCHAEEATDRYGAPGGLDFDLTLAATASQMDRLRDDLQTARSFRREILQEVREGRMPPGEAGQDVVDVSPRYRDLPAIDEPAGREILRNWLACDLPIVERIADDRPSGEEPIGVVVPASPAGPACGAGQTDCEGVCVSTATDPDHCGGCGVVCSPTEVCAGGCTSACSGDATACDRSCVDTMTSRVHCGRCDSPCGALETCEGGTCVACGAGVSFREDVLPIFTQSCVDTMCHGGRRPQEGIDLSAGGAHASLVSVPSDCGDGRLLVEPGAPDRSYLIDKLRGHNLCGGTQMPKGEDPLPDEIITMIEAWICGGARND